MKLYKVLSICAACALALLTACSDDDAKTPLPALKGETPDASYDYITFAWEGVSGATQYGYELYTSGSADVTLSGVTQDTSVTLSGLTPATDYTLKVYAFAAVDGSQTTSEPLSISARTLTAMPLGAPHLNVTLDGRYASVTWDAIPNAVEYSYELISDGSDEALEEGTKTACSLEFSGLEPGTYTLTVKAVNGSPAYVDTESEATFSIVANELWRVTGTYTSSLIDGSWPVTMVAYSDGSYKLLDWYSTDQSSLEFYIDNHNTSYPIRMSTVQYTYDSDTEAFALTVGRSGLPVVYVYPYSGRFTFTGDQTGGSVVVAVKNRNSSHGSAKRDTFTW